VDSTTVIWFVALVSAVVLHEVSHGVVALWFGDDTARRAGRLTLNPVPHIDPFGSVILPAMGALTGIPVLAWAKPVPVNPARLRRPRRDMLYVSLAGPGTNLLLMAGAAFVARALFRLDDGIYFGVGDLPLGVRVLWLFALVNLFLGVFNLLPIPPLDGSALLERVLPPRALEGWIRFRPYGILVLFLLVFSTDFVGRVFEPFVDELGEYVFG